MDSYLLGDRSFSVLDNRCFNRADTAFKDAMLVGTGDSLRAWCRKHPKRMPHVFDWLTDHVDNERVKDVVDREIERLRTKRAYLLAIYVAVLSSAISVLATWLCSDAYRFSNATTPQLHNSTTPQRHNSH
jgi:hypothetical protein